MLQNELLARKLGGSLIFLSEEGLAHQFDYHSAGCLAKKYEQLTIVSIKLTQIHLGIHQFL